MSNNETTTSPVLTEIEQSIVDLIELSRSESGKESLYLALTLLKDEESISVDFLESKLDNFEDIVTIEDVEYFMRRIYKVYYQQELKIIEKLKLVANGKNISENTNE